MIVKRGKGYGVSVYDSALKRKRWVGTFKTLSEAREAERAASRRRGVGRLRCGEFGDLWLTNYARPAGATRRTYGYGVAAFVKEFGHVRLSEFDRLTARSWALRAPQSNVRIVRAMFTDAINDQLHPGPNPLSNLRLEQSRGRKDLIALTEDELTELGEKALDVHGEFGPTFRAIVVFAAYVGFARASCSHSNAATLDAMKSRSVRTSTGLERSRLRRTVASGSSSYPRLLARRLRTFPCASTFRGSS